MPNQENVIIRVNCVTYHDKTGNVSMILLPNRELMQAISVLTVDNSFCMQMKQEWESLVIQSGTILETGWPGSSWETRQFPSLTSSRAVCFLDRSGEPVVLVVEPGHPTM